METQQLTQKTSKIIAKVYDMKTSTDFMDNLDRVDLESFASLAGYMSCVELYKITLPEEEIESLENDIRYFETLMEEEVEEDFEDEENN